MLDEISTAPLSLMSLSMVPCFWITLSRELTNCLSFFIPYTLTTNENLPMKICAESSLPVLTALVSEYTVSVAMASCLQCTLHSGREICVSCTYLDRIGNDVHTGWYCSMYASLSRLVHLGRMDVVYHSWDDDAW